MDKFLKIESKDSLNTGREKLNDAIEGSEQAVNISIDADDKATQALAKSESTQTQLDTIVIDGDSSVEAAQARVDEKGVPHPTLKARIDDGLNSVNQQLAQTETDVIELKRGNAKIYPLYITMVNDMSLKAGDFAQIAGYKRVDDGVKMTFEIMAKSNPLYANNMRLQNISAQLKNGLVAVPFIEQYTPKIVNHEIRVNEFIDTATTYFRNRDKLVYDTALAHAVFELDQNPINSNGKGGIVCSGLVNLALMGIPFENSRFVPENSVNTKKYEWGMNWLYDHKKLNIEYDANELARLAYNQGLFYTPNKDLSNIRRGDILFFSYSPDERAGRPENREFLHIFHNAVFNGWGQIIHSYTSTSRAVAIDNLNNDVWKWLKDRLIGFVRFPLGGLPRYQRQKNISFVNQTNVLVDDTFESPTVSVSENIVFLKCNNLKIRDNLGIMSQNIQIGTLSEQYQPEDIQFFWLGTLSGDMFRCRVETNGVISLYLKSNRANNPPTPYQSVPTLFGQASWSLKNITPSHPTY